MKSTVLEVTLVEPEIPPNTGNVARTCAATGTPLHLVRPLGFRLTDRHLKRAGLDYWPHVRLRVHSDLNAFLEAMRDRRLVFFSKSGSRIYYDFSFQPGDCLVFGPETRGLPEDLLRRFPERVLRIPMDCSHVRSLNLATAVGVALFEARRQLAAGRRGLGCPCGENTLTHAGDEGSEHRLTEGPSPGLRAFSCVDWTASATTNRPWPEQPARRNEP